MNLDERRDRVRGGAPQTIDETPCVPAGTPAWISEQLIRDTIRIWQPHYAETLTGEHALEMLTNCGYLFDALSNPVVLESRAGP